MIKGTSAIVVCLLAGSAVAGAVEVDAPRCAQVIHVRAQDAPLGEVLAKVAGAMGFRLDAKVELTEKVTLDRKGPPERLLKQLLQDRNLIVQTAPSAKCGGKDRIATVWVLPAGQDAPRTAATASADSAAPAPVAQLPPGSRNARPRGTRKNMSEEEWQQMKKDYAAGKIKADPDTGKPVPVEQDEAPKAPPEAP